MSRHRQTCRDTARHGRLAAGTPEYEPILRDGALAGPADRGATAAARPPGPAVDPGFPAAAPVARGDRAAAVLVGVEQPLGQGHELGQRLDVGDRAPGADAAQEQRLGPVNRAEAGQVALVQQGLADGPVRAGLQPPYRLGRIPAGTEQVGTEMAHYAFLVVTRQDLDHAEQVPERLPGVVGQDEPDPVITRQVVAGRADPPGSLHPQVGVDGQPAVYPGQQVLAPGDGAGHGPPGQVGRGEPRHPEVAAP